MATILSDAMDKLFIVTLTPDQTMRFSDGVDWYDSFEEYLRSSEQRDFEAELWREAWRKPDAVLRITSAGVDKEIPIYHEKPF